MKEEMTHLMRFQKRLAHLRSQMDAAANDPDFDENEPFVQRAVFSEALFAVCEVVEDLGWSGLNAPYVRLASGILNVNEGRADPIFQPPKDGGRPKASHVVLNIRGRIAAILQMLLDAEMSPEEATNFIARRLADDSFRALGGTSSRRGNPLSSKAIKRWRDEIGLKGGSSKPEYADGYRHMTNMIQTGPPSNAEEARLMAKSMLNRLSKSLGELI